MTTKTAFTILEISRAVFLDGYYDLASVVKPSLSLKVQKTYTFIFSKSFLLFANARHKYIFSIFNLFFNSRPVNHVKFRDSSNPLLIKIPLNNQTLIPILRSVLKGHLIQFWAPSKPTKINFLITKLVKTVCTLPNHNIKVTNYFKIESCTRICKTLID